MWKNFGVLLVLVQAWGDVTIPQHLVERFPELTTLHKRITPSQKVEQTTPPAADRVTTQKTTEEASYVEPLIVLGYKPTTTFYYPRPSTPAQLIPPGTPWPDSPKPTTLQSAEGTTSPPFISIIKSTTAQQEENDVETTAKLSTSVETTTNNTVAGDKNVTTENKFGTGENKTDATDNKTDVPAISPQPPTDLTTLLVSTETVPCLSKKSPASTHLVLTYKPTRPWYVPVPPTIGQIVPPGEPWPASAEKYPSFSQTTLPPWLLNKPARRHSLQELQSLKDLEPNALQYYGAGVTAQPKYGVQPFTSRVEKSTVPDLVDIMKEKQGAGVRPPGASRPSDLLPYDERGSLPRVRKPQTAAGDIVSNYRNQEWV